jgi:DNA-binding NarL/FixJ family response regulator
MQDLRGLTAVIAIDRSAMGETVRDALVGCYMKVPMLTEDIEKALVSCETHQPDVLFISFIFDRQPALELMRAIRRSQGGVGCINPKLPIIITSHKPQPKQVKASIQAGAHEFLALPASRETLTTVVDRALNGGRTWVDHASYSGPDRRRQNMKELPFPDRRKPSASDDDTDQSLRV